MNKGLSSLEQQVQKVFKHTRAGSFATRDKYKGNAMRAANWISQEFKLQNLKNLQDKHVAAYAKYLQAQDLKPKTVKDSLSAIRYLHDNAPQSKHAISDNKTLQQEYNFSIPKVQTIKGDRGWTKEEYSKMMDVTREIINSKGIPDDSRSARDFHDVAVMARTMGMRVAEATLASRSQAEEALRTGTYNIGSEAKNGRSRSVPLSPEGRQVLEVRVEITARGDKLFVQRNEKSHHAIDRIEQFNKNHRGKIESLVGRAQRTWTDRHQEKAYTNNLTLHGLRYNYIQDRVQQEIDKGFNREQAAQIVTKEVGHNRADVIYIYLGGKM
ncbi:phage integrase N-terminal domain-containing protein [Rossellomorea vietnamensis]|uniref:phage integrase N-terminal domain-containing protein n=1 Tax=Rossellomorea vietnamensis TaxID=218284 RepID=UPI00054D8772|nr:phage integrase N-terminal domain-containing protein [Rossellomorea vietnamensis]